MCVGCWAFKINFYISTFSFDWTWLSANFDWFFVDSFRLLKRKIVLFYIVEVKVKLLCLLVAIETECHKQWLRASGVTFKLTWGWILIIVHSQFLSNMPYRLIDFFSISNLRAVSNPYMKRCAVPVSKNQREKFQNLWYFNLVINSIILFNNSRKLKNYSKEFSLNDERPNRKEKNLME